MTDALSYSIADDYPEYRRDVAALCAKFPGEYWRNLEEQPPSGSYPSEFVQALTDAGFLSALIPEEYGGWGKPVRAGAVILETIHRSGSSAGACHAQMYTMGTVLRHGNDAQKSAFLPKIATGELRLQAFGVSEPTTGSDTTQLRTRADKCDGGYVVNGQKVWTSRAAHSDLMLLLARTTPADQVKKRVDGISVFLIDMNEAKKNGMEIVPIDAMVNHNTTEIFFDDVFIPESSLIGEEGRGFRYILDGMNAERILIAAESVGDGRWFVEKAVDYANSRVVFARPIGQNQGVQFPIANAYAHLRAADLMRWEAARLFDAGQPCGAEANLAKMLAADAAWEAANVCLQTHGGFGFATEYDVERKFREAKLYQIAPVSNNLVLAYVAQHVLGLPRSY